MSDRRRQRGAVLAIILAGYPLTQHLPGTAGHRLMRLATVQSVVAIAVVLVGVALLASAIRGVAALEPPLETAARRAPDRVLVQTTTYDCPARSDPSYEPAMS